MIEGLMSIITGRLPDGDTRKKKEVLHHPQILVHGGKSSYRNQNAK